MDVDYYTDAEQAVKVNVLEVFDGEGEGIRSHGELAVTYLPTIYKKIKLQTHENVGWGNIHLPEDTFHTTGYWLCVPRTVADALPRAELESGLLGVAHVLGQVAPLFLMCDPRDVSVWPEVRSTFTGAPTIYMYDGVPGGIGFSKRLYNVHQQLLGSAGAVVTRCPCERGCPSCIGPLLETSHNPKLSTIRLVSILLDEIRLPSRITESAPS